MKQYIPASRFTAYWRYLAGIACLTTLLCLSASAQKPAERKGEGKSPTGRERAEVAVLVMPVSADEARVALTYSRKVERSRVRREIDSLVRFAGGHFSGNVAIRDYSLDPKNLAHFPVTTSAEFTLVQSPQFQDAEPRVLPYLQAFQKWGSLDVLFHLPGATESVETLQFESERMSVWLNRDTGVYQYHAEIAAGESALPIPVFLPATVSNATSNRLPTSAAASTEQPAASGSTAWPVLLILAGIGLAGCAGFYLFMQRRSARKVSVHPR